MRGGLFALLALAVGLGVGYLLGASRDAAVPARGASPGVREVAPDLGPLGRTPLAEALRDLPLPDVERGAGTITGRVTRGDGSPVAGVLVRAARGLERRPRVDGVPPAPDLGEEVRRFVADFRTRQMSAIEAVTGSDGRYLLPGLADGTYDLAAYLAGHRISTGTPRARPGATVDFRAEEVLEVAFEVLLPDGTSAPDATIQLKAGDRSSSHAWSREAPNLQLPAGSFVCFAEHRDGTYRSEEVPLDVPARPPAPPTVQLRLHARYGIVGTLFFGSDLPFNDASVGALAFTGDKPPDAKRLSEGQGQQRDWTSRDRGFRYRLLDLPPGRYLVGVALDMAVVATRVVDVGERIETCDFSIDTIDPSLFLVVRVLDPAGKPVTDATFERGYRTDNGSSSSSRGNEFPPRADGSYVILHQQHHQQEGGTYWVAAESPRLGKKQVDYKRGETKEVVIRFGDAATVELTVAGFVGADHADAITAALVPATADEDRAFDGADESKHPDRQGRLVVGPVEAGDYDLVLFARHGDPWSALRVATRRITLVAGKNPVTVPMPRLFTLTVTDPARKAATLHLATEGWDATDVEGEADGEERIVFHALPEGRYLLARVNEAGGAMRVHVPASLDVVFRQQAYSAFRVVLAGIEGGWTRAGLADGDLIVAIDGDELESSDELQAAHAILPTKERATLAVLRAGSRIELRVNAKELFADGTGRLGWTVR